MGIFSKNGKNKGKTSESYVIPWVEQSGKNFGQNGLKEPTEAIFLLAIKYLSNFSVTDSQEKVTERNEDFGFGNPKLFKNDAALFELGCYLFIRLDVWLLKRKENLRQQISVTFMNKFVDLFSEALQLDTVGELFDERIAKYGEFIRKGENLETYHFYLSQLILRTKDGALPTSYNFGHEPLVLDFEDICVVRVALQEWEASSLSGMFEGLEELCEFLE